MSEKWPAPVGQQTRNLDWLQSLPAPIAPPIKPPTMCAAVWGDHYDEHGCDIPVEEHMDGVWQHIHECDCGSEHDDRGPA